MAVYAVKEGYQRGIFNTWEECRASINGYSGAEFKKFQTRKYAEQWLNGCETVTEVKQDYPEVAGDGEIILYVDGSYNNKTGVYGSGVVAITEYGITELKGCDSERVFRSMQSIAGELLATAIGVVFATDNNYRKITICHDNQGIKEWTRHGHYRRNKTGTIAYREFMDRMEDEYGLELKFVHVKGHDSIKYNLLADRLAKSAITQDRRVDTLMYFDLEECVC